jgi:molybdopterin-containing oxidoreductase family iron-sulfur binding subunit
LFNMSSMKKTGGPRLWRSLAEYEQDPEFEKYLENEFPTPLTEAPPNSKERRRFIQLMAASFSLAGASGCRWEEDKLVPMTRRPEGMIPGVPREYSTSMDLGGSGMPLRVKSYDGRPIKVDGNPLHPDSGGASTVHAQAAILSLYDPDRSHSPAQNASGKLVDASWEDFATFSLKHFLALRPSGGQGLFVLSEPSSSETVRDMKERFATVYPRATWLEYEPVNRDSSAVGSQLAFGQPVRTHYDLGKAEVVLCLDADPLASGPDSLAMARGFSDARSPETGKANRLWSVESSLSPTGIQADHRLAIKTAQIASLVVALEVAISAAVGDTSNQKTPEAKFLQDPDVAKFVGALTRDLLSARGRSAVLVGEGQPPPVHALVHRLNALLDNAGSTVTYTTETNTPNQRLGLQGLVARAAEIKTLVILGGNPLYASTADVDFASVLKGDVTSVHLSLYRDETSRACSWHVPMAHFLEAWGDTRSYDGTVLLSQPLVAPLFSGLSVPEFLAVLRRDEERDGQSLVRRALGQKVTGESAWRRAVHDGFVAGTAAPSITPELSSVPPLSFGGAALGGVSPTEDPLEVTFAADPKLHDGRFANNGWLQELPDTAMKLTWDNAALISPKTAEALGIEDCTLVTISVQDRTITLPALMSPGQAPGSIRLSLGYGRTDAGVVGGARDPKDADPVDPVGVSVYPLRSVGAWDAVQGAKVTPTGRKYKLATTQDKHPMDDIGRKGTQERLPLLVRQDTFAHFKENPDHIQHMVHHPPLLSLWQEPVSYEGYKWGMTIDLNKCTGCNACVVACNAENNIPIVGKSQVLMGREMHWMRIDRYWQGEDPDKPVQVHNQPVLCQHCEHAPCEQVCPVGATLHSSEGLNDMTYNRCIGTRYCSNNCPYKVRRFNYFNYSLPLTEERNEITRMAQNPEVTVRFRGVMEKCSFCTQRISAAKITAKNAKRKVKDGEVRSACQDACPTRAIQFGDLNDPNSGVAKSASSSRNYALLEELNIRPRVTYLGRITNPHPDMSAGPAQGNDETHG